MLTRVARRCRLFCFMSGVHVVARRWDVFFALSLAAPSARRLFFVFCCVRLNVCYIAAQQCRAFFTTTVLKHKVRFDRMFMYKMFLFSGTGWYAGVGVGRVSPLAGVLVSPVQPRPLCQ